MSTDSFEVLMSGAGTSLSPDEIERELSSMWKPLEEGEDHGASVSRVALGNVIWVGVDGELERLKKIVQKVVPKYPCRFFLLEYSPDREEEEVKAAVNAQCFVPKPGAPPVCCEVIHMTFGPASAKHLAGCVAPLLITDLQVVLWESLEGIYLKEFNELQELSDRTLTQASLACNPFKVLQRVSKLPYRTYDLSWFRITELFNHLTAYFDDPSEEFDLLSITDVKIEIVKNKSNRKLPSIMAGTFVGWLASKLNWTPVGSSDDGFLFKNGKLAVTVIVAEGGRPRSETFNNLKSVELTDRHGRLFHMSMHQDDEEMDLWCGKGPCPTTGQRIFVSEASEEDALGLALNTPSSHKSFIKVLEASLPVIEYLLDHHEE